MNLQPAKEQAKKRTIFLGVAELLVPHFPDLRDKLKLANMNDNPVDFLEKIVRNSLGMSSGLILVAYLLSNTFFSRDAGLGIVGLMGSNLGLFLAIVLLPLLVIPPTIFFWFMLYPLAARLRRQREIDYELVFAGRHIAIALKSGMPLFDALAGAATGYGAVSKEISQIVDKVVLGTPIAQAIRETTSNSPSSYFTRMMIQMANSIASGADVGNALDAVLDQISREQMIALKEYSQKLTPLIMFYMVIGIVVPSLGIVLMTVIFSSISGGVNGLPPYSLFALGLITAIVQILFLGFIESSRPRYLI